MRTLLATACLASIAWLAAIMIAPASIGLGRPTAAHAVAALTYGVGSRICHQRPDRSLRLARVPMPVCARCTGLYLGLPVGLAFALWTSRRSHPWPPLPERASRALLLWVAVPTVVSVGLEWAGGIDSPPVVRLALATLLAAVAAWVCAERLAREGWGR